MDVEGEEVLSLSASYRPPSVLLCDDSTTERTALAQYLRQQGFNVHEVEGGEPALEFLKSHELDIVLLDLQMPDVSGFDVLGYLQEHRKGLPVLLLSGMPLDQIQHGILELPKHELPPLFLKPVDLEQLMQVIELQLNSEMPEIPKPTDWNDPANS